MNKHVCRLWIRLMVGFWGWYVCDIMCDKVVCVTAYLIPSTVYTYDIFSRNSGVNAYSSVNKNKISHCQCQCTCSNILTAVFGQLIDINRRLVIIISSKIQLMHFACVRQTQAIVHAIRILCSHSECVPLCRTLYAATHEWNPFGCSPITLRSTLQSIQNVVNSENK